MDMKEQIETSTLPNEDGEDDIDPICDIVDYLVRCAKISFKNAHVDQSDVRTSEKIKLACDLYKKSPTEFLLQFGKHLAPYHLGYFEKLQSCSDENYQECMRQLKSYHSDASRRNRVRNRRFNALKKLQTETEYFSEKQMMYRNPLLYEQLIGQYLTDDEIRERDGVDNKNLTLLNMILETVDRNQMREMKNEQMLEEEIDSMTISNEDESKNAKKPQWGDFETPDTQPDYKPEIRKQSMISGPERNLLREEFYQEMCNSFMEGKDEEVDYRDIDNDEQYDDLKQVSQDAEDQYFDSETNEVENLEEHMKLVEEYGRIKLDVVDQDPLDVFMTHISDKLGQCCCEFYS